MLFGGTFNLAFGSHPFYDSLKPLDVSHHLVHFYHILLVFSNQYLILSLLFVNQILLYEIILQTPISQRRFIRLEGY